MTSPRTRLICPLTGPDLPAMREQMRRAAEAGADMVECRLDYLAERPDEASLRELLGEAPLEVIATCRPYRQGGTWPDEDETNRLALLRAAVSAGAQWADVEWGTPREQWPDARIILSHHDFHGLPDDLDAVADRMAAEAPDVVKLAYIPAMAADALRCFDLIRRLDRPTIALAMGMRGLISRLLAGKFGAWGTFAALVRGEESAAGQPTLDEIRGAYRWDAIDAETEVYGVIGCPVAHSMSPPVHNAAFDETGLNAVYLPMRVEPGGRKFDAFFEGLRARAWLHVRGLSVTIPHKVNALSAVEAAHVDDLALRIGAINTLTLSGDGQVRGNNTDYGAALDALCGAMGIAREALADQRVAVLGAGGVARAIVAALVHYGAKVVIHNRTPERASQLAAEFGCRAAELADAPGRARIVINCTPVGMSPSVEPSPLETLKPSVRTVFDTIYNPPETALLRQAREAGCTCVGGMEMFVNQAVAQFETWTQAAAPRERMAEVVRRRLGGESA